MAAGVISSFLTARPGKSIPLADRGRAEGRLRVAKERVRAEIPSMKPVENQDLQDTDQSIGKMVKRAIRRPRKAASGAEALRGWAKSAIKSRNKS
jgi:hypothetical protein